ncbi:MAG: MaoC family dehydratase [Gammaproteobacteria bacterium]|nr:MaoC family dehydratase [Gammaproteobacteria bacterium]MBT4492406.1 MaoC family dehydratase [Gammaproteobacteria bacterium]MBT7370002.1 MaoC family dehydratase [Gammaproteobacteria bacterium]
MTIETGFEIPPWDMPSVSPDRMKTMAAILRDPYPVHWDPRVVEQIGLGKRTINQGPLGLSYMINMLHDWTGIGSIKRLRMTFPLPVFQDDHIIARGQVTEVRVEDGKTVADCDIWLDRDGEDKPLVGTATVSLDELSA